MCNVCMCVFVSVCVRASLRVHAFVPLWYYVLLLVCVCVCVCVCAHSCLLDSLSVCVYLYVKVCVFCLNVLECVLSCLIVIM